MKLVIADERSPQLLDNRANFHEWADSNRICTCESCIKLAVVRWLAWRAKKEVEL